MSKYLHQTFRPKETISKVLEEVPYGKKSDFINLCIEKHAEEAGIEIQKKSAPNDASENSTKKSGSNASTLTQQKPSEEVEATTQKNSQPSLQTIRNIGELTKSLKPSEEKP